jgi:hypothetical protein
MAVTVTDGVVETTGLPDGVQLVNAARPAVQAECSPA